MKKIIILSLCLVLLAALALGVSADGVAYMQLNRSASTVQRGETFTITVNLTNDQPVSTGGLFLSYDSSVFTVLGGTLHVGQGGVDSNGGVFAMSSDTVVSGTIFTITVQVKESAPFGTYTIGGSASLKGAGNAAISCSAGSATITVACKHNYQNCTQVSGDSHQSTCSICQDVKKESHSWNGGTVTKAATCTSTGTKNLKCTGCGATKEETIPKQAHNFDNVILDADTHQQTCKTCGFRQTGTHSYGSWENEATGHFKTCTVCGQKAEQADHVPGPKATEDTDQICTVCNRILQPMGKHVHNFADTWTSDDASHWHACSDCSEKGSVAVHDFADNCDPDCSICGYSRQAPHRAGAELTADENGHWFTCADCGEKLEEASHTPGPDATVSSPQLCLDCGYAIAPVLPHDHVYNANGTTHQHFCACGEIYETTAEDCTVCGGFPWMWVCIGEAVLFATLLLHLHIRLRKRSKAAK